MFLPAARLPQGHNGPGARPLPPETGPLGCRRCATGAGPSRGQPLELPCRRWRSRWGRAFQPRQRIIRWTAGQDAEGSHVHAEAKRVRIPDATNTGVPPGTPLTVVNGTVTLSTDGQVFSNRDVRGSIVVTGDNVTIEKVRVTGRSQVPLIYTRGGSAVIRDVEVNMSGEEAGKGIAFDNYTAQRVWFHNGLDCAHRAGTSRSPTRTATSRSSRRAAAPTPTASSRTAAGTTCSATTRSATPTSRPRRS